ncbi:MAG: protein secretion chaperonin CsaA [Candidatus Limnocylindrales bacterium]
MKQTASPGSFEQLDLRIGRVIAVAEALTRKPTYRLSIDFGPELGTKISCGAYRNYRADELVGRLVVAVVNLGPKKMGPETSDVLVLGVTAAGGTIFLTTESDVPVGAQVS